MLHVRKIPYQNVTVDLFIQNFSLLNYNKDVDNSSNEVEKSKEQERKEYNLKVLRQVQAIFGHLSESKLQFHIPRGFWKSFRYDI